MKYHLLIVTVVAVTTAAAAAYVEYTCAKSNMFTKVDMYYAHRKTGTLLSILRDDA